MDEVTLRQFIAEKQALEARITTDLRTFEETYGTAVAGVRLYQSEIWSGEGNRLIPTVSRVVVDLGDLGERGGPQCEGLR